MSDTPLRDIADRAALIYLSEDEVNKEWRDVLGHNTGAAPTVELLLAPANSAGLPLFEFENLSGIKSYIGALSAPQIHQLYNRHREKLFNLNIRNYIGDTRTNKEIIRTAVTDGDKFFFYNNGISAVATEVKVQSRGTATVLSCKDFSLINGAQTFRSLSKAHTRSVAGQSKAVRVLIRISEIDFRKDEGAEVVDRVTRFNNTQNSMKLSDFRSNDPVQQSLVRYVSDVNAHEGRKYLYRNKRTQGSERNKINVKMDEFCRAIFAYQFGAVDFFGSQAYLYDTSVDGGYAKLFGKELAALSQPEFERLFGIWLITSNVDLYLKEDKANLSKPADDEFDILRKNALERKYLVFYAVGEVLRDICKLQNNNEANLLRTYSKPRWQLDKDRAEILKEAFSVACDMVVQAYQMAQRTPGFVHRNFFRDQNTLASIRDARAARRGQLQKLSERLASKAFSATA